MKPGPFGSAHSHGDLLNLEVIEDKRGVRRTNGLPARYAKGRFLGKGGFAKCYEVQDMETKEVYAAKIVSKASIVKPRAHAKLRSEIAIHRSLDHDKVVKFYDYFEDPESVYIILELCPNQTLNELMRKRASKRLSEPEAMFYAYDLITALKYLHRRRVIHRDLKLGNLFLDGEMRIKVGDFGLAAQLEHDGEKKRTICGTPNYIAPEILEGKHGHAYEVDVWSLGVILYTMVIGRPPFETSDVKTTYRRIRYNQYGFPDTVRISDQVKELITRILRTDPRARPSLDEILGASWFHGAQRLPPPMPVSIAGFTVSPRLPHGGGSSARSETPERGVADFARIDSPVGRFPLRDRSPGSVPNTAAYNAGAPLPVQTAPPLLSGKQPQQGVGAVPSRSASVGRPPLAAQQQQQQRLGGNDENAAPPCGANVCCVEAPGERAARAGHTQAASARRLPDRRLGGDLCGYEGTAAEAPSPAPPTAAPTPARSMANGMTNSASVGHFPPPASASQQQPSSARAGYTSARSATCSPRQVVAPPTSVRVALGSGATPKAVAAAAAANLFPRATPQVLRSSAPPLSTRTQGNAGDSPSEQPTTGESTPAAGGGAAHSSSARGHQATPPPSSAAERKQLSVRRSDGITSSPAIFFDAAFAAAAAATAAAPEGRAAGPPAPPLDQDAAPALAAPAPGGAGGLRSARGPGAPAPRGGGAAGRSQQEQQQPAVPGAELWVVKWVDYSSKYGLGYTLSDGCIGVYFNDSTKIVSVPDGSQFDYVTRRTQDRPELRSTHSFEEYPEELKKKVTLLKHFKNCMLSDSVEKKDQQGRSFPVVQNDFLDAQAMSELGLTAGLAGGDEAAKQPHFVKKWTRNKHAIMFQLSNKIVQVVFFDKTEVILSSKSHTVTYVDKRGQVCAYPLSNVLDVPSPELAKRLKYTKDILVNLLGAKTTDLAGVQ